MRRGIARTEKTPAFAAARGDLSGDSRITRMSTEQSNTSIVFGDRLILKLFRRVAPGDNPDYEIGRFLSETVKFDRVPPVAGAIHYERPAEAASTIGLLQRFVESQTDGWEHATDELSRFYDQVASSEPPAPSPTPSFSALADTPAPKRIQDVMGPYLSTAETLGRRSAEMHLALAGDSSDPSFAPEPFSQDDMKIVSAHAVAEAGKALHALESRLGTMGGASNGLSADVVERAGELLLSRDRLLSEVRTGPAVEFTITKIRVHGDYHLGQVLWAEGDFYILDFEGEPASPLEVRRQKQSPLRDVAGMLRSFSYAAYAALFAYASARPAEFSRIEPWARIWQTWATAAFLRGYFRRVENAMFLPVEPSHRDALLRFFMLNKALYELNYEVNNRPEWLRIPLWGILDLL